MWESLPIQRRNMRGTNFSFIFQEKEYNSHKDVEFARWKNVPSNIQNWCISILQDYFLIQRNPIENNDLLFWIPQKALLVAKYGHFIGPSKSRRMIYVCYNVVCEHFRREGLSGHLILTMANKCKEIYGPITFMFELERVPPSLQDAVPYMKFTYVWIPFLYRQEKNPVWKPIKEYSFLKKYPGFHNSHWKGYRAFTNGSDHIVFDPSNDIVYYSNYLTLYFFDGMKIPGAYCRVFSPFGNVSVFIENMYYDNIDYFQHSILI